MSLEFIDGFDHYTSQANMALKWGGVGFANPNATGRFSGSLAFELGGNTNSLPNDPFVLLPSLESCTVGFAIQFFGTPSSGPFVLFVDNYAANSTDGIQAHLWYETTTGLITASNSNNPFTHTVIGTCSGTYVPNVWYYIEVSITVGSAGALKVAINGQTVLNLSSVTLQNSGSATFNNLFFNGLTLGSIYVDDLYVDNTPNAFLGDCRIITVLPAGDSAVNNAWAPNSGSSHYSRVNETNPDGDASYNASATAGAIDTYTFPAISTPSVIAGVQHVFTARKDDAATRVLVSECRRGGTNYDGANSFAMGSSYGMFRQMYLTDPATGSAWVRANLNAAEFGAKVIS